MIILLAVFACGACAAAGDEAESEPRPAVTPAGDLPHAQVDRILHERILAAGRVRALVTVRTVTLTGSDPLAVAGVLDGPYARLKRAALESAGRDVALVTDYDRLAVVLVDIKSVSALDALADRPTVAAIKPVRRSSVH